MIQVSMLVRADRAPGLWRVVSVGARTVVLRPMDADAACHLWAAGAVHYLLRATSLVRPYSGPY